MRDWISLQENQTPTPHMKRAFLLNLDSPSYVVSSGEPSPMASAFSSASEAMAASCAPASQFLAEAATALEQ